MGNLTDIYEAIRTNKVIEENQQKPSSLFDAYSMATKKQVQQEKKQPFVPLTEIYQNILTPQTHYIKEAGNPKWFVSPKGLPNSSELARLIRAKLVEMFPTKYNLPSSGLYRIKSLTAETTIDDLQKHILEVKNEIDIKKGKITLPLDIDNNSFETIDPGTQGSPSSSYPMLRFDVLFNDKRIPTGIMLAGKPAKFATPVKEGMPGLLFLLGVNGQITKNSRGQGEFKSTCETLKGEVTLVELLEKLANLKESSVPKNSLDSKTITDCKNTAVEFLRILRTTGVLKADYLNQLNDAISTAKALIDKGFTPAEFIFERGQLYDIIRNIGKSLSNVSQADIWCPADVYIIRKSLHDSVLPIMQSYSQNELDALAKVNGMFAQKIKPESVDNESPILGISLKQEAAQLGKAKWYLNDVLNLQNNFNLTPEELKIQDPNWFTENIKQKLQNVILFAKQYDSIEIDESRGMNINVYDNTLVCNICDDINKMRMKYAAFKILDAIIALNDPLQFKNIALASMKVLNPENIPSFFKIVGNSKGDATISSQAFENIEQIGNVIIKELFNTNTQQITFIILLQIKSNDETTEKKIQIDIRPIGYNQVTIEGKAIKK